MTFYIAWIIIPIILLGLFVFGKLMIRLLRSVGFKEWWKSKPYWLKGGIIGIIIGAILALPFLLCGFECSGEQCMGCIFWGIPAIISTVPIGYLIGVLISLVFPGIAIQNESIESLIFSLYITVNTFAIGALIGWIVGKIKSKKE